MDFSTEKEVNFFSCFLKFHKQVENQLDRKIKVFKCDGGGEFQFNKIFNHLWGCKKKE